MQPCPFLGLFSPPLPEQENPDGDSEYQRRGASTKAHDIHCDRRVAAICRIVVIAVEDQLVKCRTGPAFSRLEQREFELFGGILDPIKIPRYPAVRGADENRRGVGVLLRNRIVGVGKAHGFGQAFDLQLAAGHEVPAARRRRALEAFEVVLLLRLARAPRSRAGRC